VEHSPYKATPPQALPPPRLHSFHAAAVSITGAAGTLPDPTRREEPNPLAGTGDSARTSHGRAPAPPWGAPLPRPRRNFLFSDCFFSPSVVAVFAVSRFVESSFSQSAPEKQKMGREEKEFRSAYIFFSPSAELYLLLA